MLDIVRSIRFSNVFLFQYKNFAGNQPELYRPNDNDDDDVGAANITAKEIEQEAKEVSESLFRWTSFSHRPRLLLLQASRTLQKGKPMIRRKSELPHDYATLNALEKHKRPNDFLTTASESNPNAQ